MAKLNAQKIAFGPFIFQVVKSARDLGILKTIEDSKDSGIAIDAIAKQTNISNYSVKVLLDASESMDVVKKIDNKYRLTKTGYFC